MAALIHYSDKFNDLKGMSCGEVLVRATIALRHTRTSMSTRFGFRMAVISMIYAARAGRVLLTTCSEGEVHCLESWLTWTTTKRNCHILLILIPTGDYASPETVSLSLCCGSTQRAACGSDILEAVGGGQVLLWSLILAALRLSIGLHKRIKLGFYFLFH